MSRISVPYSQGHRLQLPITWGMLARWGPGFQSPIHRVIDCNISFSARTLPDLAEDFSPLFTGSSTATADEQQGARAHRGDFSPLFTGSSTATPAPVTDDDKAFWISVPYSQGHRLQHRYAPLGPSPADISVPYSQGHRLQRPWYWLYRLRRKHFSPLFTGSSTATAPQLALLGQSGQQFQSPIHRVIDCNDQHSARLIPAR